MPPIAPPAIRSPRPPSRTVDVAVRVNQAGYRPEEPKTALVLARASLAGQPFQVLCDDGSVALSGQVGDDRGPYGAFGHLYEVDFSGLTSSGRYHLQVGKTSSPSFDVRSDVCDSLIPSTLDFFGVQRCGTQPARLHGPCHVEDAVASGGPTDGQRVHVQGGWHDAGDYLEFMTTAGVTDVLMLSAYHRHPDAFPIEPGATEPRVLQEARIGLDWMLSMWDPQNQVLYYQVGDETDHDSWRMPEEDQGPRKAWACDPGCGANLAGRTAASLALASVIYNDRTKPFYNPTLAATYLAGAEGLYAWGKTRPAPQSTNPSDFYPASTTDDDMALAAAELHRATGRADYLAEARSYAAQAGGAQFNVGHVHALAHYEIARLDPSYRPTATAMLEADLKPLRDHAERDPFNSALSRFTWGSVEFLTGTALEALWYEDLSGDSSYREMAQQQRDYVLGRNPWGVSLVSGSGTEWAHHPHHQIADLTQSQIAGIWDQGPCNASDWAAQHITLDDPESGREFQTPDAVFHDDVRDYVTNEPTINTNALGLAMASWYASGVRRPA